MLISKISTAVVIGVAASVVKYYVTKKIEEKIKEHIPVYGETVIERR